MQLNFRIPQSLDGFETAVLEGGFVSQEALAAARTRADSNLPWSDSLITGQGDASWNEESCMQIYCFLYHVGGQHAQKASQLKLVAQFLSSASLSAAEPKSKIDEALSSSGHGTDLSLSVFFTCHLLQRVEVSTCTYAAAGLQIPEPSTLSVCPASAHARCVALSHYSLKRMLVSTSSQLGACSHSRAHISASTLSQHQWADQVKYCCSSGF